MLMPTCLVCGKFFSNNGRQKFCSIECAKRSNKITYYETEVKRPEPAPDAQVLRSFYCRCCGSLVNFVDHSDKRTVYCCAKCERKYWRDVTRHPSNRHGLNANLGMSAGMSLGGLIRRELRDLD